MAAMQNTKRKKEILKACLYILAGVIVAYLIFMFSDFRRNSQDEPSEVIHGNNATTTNEQVFDWENEIVKIERAVGPKFLDIDTKVTGSMTVSKKADITGDGQYEALVSLASSAAYNEYFALLTYKDSAPTLAKFKQKDGQIGDVLFLQGASASHGTSVLLDPDQKAIYSQTWGLDPVNPDAVSCEAEAYIWNQTLGFFEYNSARSEVAANNYCAEIAKSGYSGR